MPNHKSAKKRVRQTAKRMERNKTYRSRMRNVIKKFMAAVEAKKGDEATALFKTATKVIDRTASKGVIHKAQASRRVSRLARHLNNVSAS